MKMLFVSSSLQIFPSAHIRRFSPSSR
jgi:hypothetical protein